jgi:hypothetical protein
MSARWLQGLVGVVGLFVAGIGAAPALAQEQPPAEGTKYALLVGVRTYIPTELRPLKFAENDVTQLAETLRQGGYKADNVRLMTKAAADEDPSLLPLAANIRRELKQVAAKCQPGDSLLIALAGHGVQFRDSDENFFCPGDARLADRSTLIGFGEVFKELEGCQASFKLLLVDACRNDPLADVTRARQEVDLQSTTRPRLKQPPGGVAALFSCSAGEVAFEDPDLGHGVFFHYVIEGLRGDADRENDGVVYLPDLEVYTKKRVGLFVQRKYTSVQTPDLVSKGTRGLVPLVKTARNTVAMSGFFEDAGTLTFDGSKGGMPPGPLALGPQGKTVAVRMQDFRSVTEMSYPQVVWDPATGRELGRLGNSMGMVPVTYSPDGKFFALVNQDAAAIPPREAINVYDAASAKVIASLPLPGGFTQRLAFTADSQGLLIGTLTSTQGDKGLRYQRFDLAARRVGPVWAGGPQVAAGVVAVSANGRWLARVAGTQLEVIDLTTGRTKCRCTCAALADPALGLSHGGQLADDGSLFVTSTVATGGTAFDGTFKSRLLALETATGKQFPALEYENLGEYRICPDHKTLAVRWMGAFREGVDPTHFEFVDLATARKRPLSIPITKITGFDISPDGTKLATLHQMPGGKWAIRVGDLPKGVCK